MPLIAHGAADRVANRRGSSPTVGAPRTADNEAITSSDMRRSPHSTPRRSPHLCRRDTVPSPLGRTTQRPKSHDGDESLRILVSRRACRKDGRTGENSVATTLSSAGFATREAANGESALAIVRTDPPTLVLLDVCLPGLNGYELCRQLRDQFGEQLPIILLSGDRTQPLDRSAGLLIGSDDYLSSQSTPTNCSHAYAGSSRVHAQTRPSQPRPTSASPTANSWCSNGSQQACPSTRSRPSSSSARKPSPTTSNTSSPSSAPTANYKRSPSPTTTVSYNTHRAHKSTRPPQSDPSHCHRSSHRFDRVRNPTKPAPPRQRARASRTEPRPAVCPARTTTAPRLQGSRFPYSPSWPQLGHLIGPPTRRPGPPDHAAPVSRFRGEGLVACADGCLACRFRLIRWR